MELLQCINVDIELVHVHFFLSSHHVASITRDVRVTPGPLLDCGRSVDSTPVVAMRLQTAIADVAPTTTTKKPHFDEQRAPRNEIVRDGRLRVASGDVAPPS